MDLTFQKGAAPNVLKYPLTEDQLRKLRPCRLASPRVGNSHGYKVPVTFNLQESAEEILKIRDLVEGGRFPYEFMEKYNPFKRNFGSVPTKIPGPLALAGLSYGDPEALSRAVHMDFPNDLGRFIHIWLLSRKYNVRKDTDRFIDFLESVPQIEGELTRGNGAGLEKIFQMKYYFGVPRPEEVLGYNMTAYLEGCPTHPSTPAGHSAVCGATALCLINNFELDPRGMREVLFSVYIFGMARSIAGVHHAIDNILGMMAAGLEPYMREEVVKLYKQ